jgi:hypothetical protein
MKLRRSLYAQPVIIRESNAPLVQHRPSRGRSCPSPECWMVLGGIPAESPSAKRPSTSVRSSRSMMAVPSGDEDGHVGSPSRRCHPPERNTDLEARNHGVSGAEPAIGPELPERVEQVRAGLPAADRAGSSRTWTRRWTWIGRPGIWGRSTMSSRAGGAWCGLVSTAVGCDRGAAAPR